MSSFTTLLLSLPTGHSTLRMRLWRALKATGCAVLRDGVYVLPATAPQREALSSIEGDVRKAGGNAMTAELSVQPSELPRLHALFDRTAEYGELVAKIDAARRAAPRSGAQRGRTAYERMKRAFDEVSAIDF